MARVATTAAVARVRVEEATVVVVVVVMEVVVMVGVHSQRHVPQPCHFACNGSGHG